MIDQLTTTVTDALDDAKRRLASVTTLDLTNLELSKLDPRNIDLPKLDLSKLDPRNVDLPKVDLPNLPAGVERVADVARDAVYAGIGAAVVAAERADAEVRRAVRRVA